VGQRVGLLYLGGEWLGGREKGSFCQGNKKNPVGLMGGGGGGGGGKKKNKPLTPPTQVFKQNLKKQRKKKERSTTEECRFRHASGVILDEGSSGGEKGYPWGERLLFQSVVLRGEKHTIENSERLDRRNGRSGENSWGSICRGNVPERKRG